MEVEVTNISTHGLWIFTNDKEFFLSYEQFPWFKNKTIDEIIKVEKFGKNHLYWSKIDVDLTLEMIKHPKRFPLKAKTKDI